MRNRMVIMTVTWEHFSHGADIGIRGIGHTLEQAFEQGAIALCGVITEPGQVEAKEAIYLELEAPEADLLFMDWLNELIYEMAVRGMLFSHFSVKIDGSRLRATARGEKAMKQKHEPAVEVKGATFTELLVAQQADGTWVAQCVVDV